MLITLATAVIHFRPRRGSTKGEDMRYLFAAALVAGTVAGFGSAMPKAAAAQAFTVIPTASADPTGPSSWRPVRSW
jgi:hypothetical protein